MKFVLGYRTELFMIFLVPIQALQWYRFLRYSGTDSSAMMVPIRALRWYRLTDTIITGMAIYHIIQKNWMQSLLLLLLFIVPKLLVMAGNNVSSFIFQ